MLKKGKFLLLVLAMALISTTVVVAQDDYENGYEPAITVTIFHTNDVHGRFLPSNTAIGIDTIAAIRNHYAPNAILVDAGDTFHGLPFATLNRGLDIVELMNAAGYSVFTPGNHDFNFGTDRLLELEAAANFDFISANVYRDGELLFDDIVLREINGVTIGFFGLAHPSTAYLTNPNNVAGVSFANPIEAAERSVALLQEMDVDIIVALAHLGSGARSDYRIDGYAIAVAEAVPGIDIIIDGHSHNLHEGGLLVGDTFIVQAGDHGRYLGRIDIIMYEGEVQSIVASAISQEYAIENFEPNAYIQTLIEDIQARQSEIMDVVVGYLPATLYVDYIRSQEMPIGNLIADAVRFAAGTEIAFTNGGGIRDILPAGDITKGNIVSVLPFGNYIVTLEVTPAILAAALENGVSALPGGGRFPQVSGFSFVFNPDAEEGYRVLAIYVDGQSLDLTDETTTFTLATNNFIAAGGDAFTMFADLPILMELGNLDEILIAYIPYADLENLSVEGRIVESDVVLEVVISVLPEADEVEVVETVELADVSEVVLVGTGSAIVANCWFLNVRARGSVYADVIGYLRAGDVVSVLDSTAWGWYKIQTPYITGWVFGRYLEMN